MAKNPLSEDSPRKGDSYLKSSNFNPQTKPHLFQGFDRELYNRDYVIKNNKEKEKRRKISNNSAMMRNSLMNLGVIESEEDLLLILEDKIPR